LLGVVLAAACSSSGSAARDASGADHQAVGDAAIGDRPTDLAHDLTGDGGDAVSIDGSDASLDAASGDGPAETVDERDDGDSADTDARSEHGASDGGATSDGAGGDAASDGDALPCPTCAFYPTFMFGGEQTTSPAPGLIRYQAGCGIDLFNGSDQTVSLAGVKVRYWFTSDLSQWNVSCVGNCSVVQTTSIVGIPARNGADTYLEIVFAPGQLGAFSDVGPIQFLFDATDNNAFFDRPLIEDDYSFQTDPTMPDAHITVYANNKLVWGTEP
jgi:hypothetical protein